MSKLHSNWNALGIGLISVVIGLVSMVFTGSIFNLFLVAIIVAVLWDYTEKVNRLEVKLSQVEAKLWVDQSDATR